jgi:hypothetical protein
LEHLRSEAIVPAEGDAMSKIEYLQEQAARAERLAKAVMDALTAQRLQSFAAACRHEIRTQAENERPRETTCHPLATENAEDGDAGLHQELPVANKKVAELI